MWLWLLLALLVCVIVAMEVFQATALKKLGAKPPRSILVLRVVNISLLTAAVAYAAWAYFSKGR